MKFVLKKKKGIEYELTVTVPFEQINLLQKKEIINIKNTIIINGFRKNKTPIYIIKNLYKKQIQKHTIEKAIYNTFKKIIKNKKLNIINQEEILIKKYPDNSELVYSVILEAVPEINYDQLKNKPTQKILILKNETNFNEYIQNLINNQGCWITKKGHIKKNNKVTIAYQIFQKNTANKFYQYEQKYSFILNQNAILPEIERNILNKTSNDSFSTKIFIPNVHPDINFQGQEINVNICIKKIEYFEKIYSIKQFLLYLKKILNIHNDENIYLILKKQFNKDIQNLEYQHLKHNLIQSLLHIDISKDLLNAKHQNIQKNIQHEYINNKGNIFELKYHTDINNEVLNYLKTELIIKSITYQTELKVSQNEINKYIYNIRKTNDSFSLQYKKIQDKTILNDQIKNIILEKKIINYLIQLSHIQNVEYSYKQALKNY